ncbi:MAG: hypothetical protein EA376_03195 [Phycisphaeraceae bacterium]|nr:MAG: hypothetical protein EA376_03195 [Phycisphaeraceae bacterium]
MTSGSPSTIGPYTIDRELGRGGMGVVYLGHDSRLDRAVAIKALPEHLAMDPDRLARFEREARTLASLNHPNVAGIHGVEEQGGQKFLVLEYVEGETLAERLDRGALPMDEAIDIAIQIAQGLEAAHDKGVIHRDLKPGNIMLTREGAAKVLDFGLARTADGTPSSTGLSGETNAPTLTSPAYAHSPTIPGAIMGTAGYMSPEQARGRPVDKRSDIFSFGCVLYEMLVGGRPFSGDTVADVLGATLHKQLDLTILPPQTPAGVRRLLQRCLEKDKRNRLHDIADARIELQSAGADEPAPAAHAPARIGAVGVVLACALCALLAGVGAWLILPRAAPPGASEARAPVIDTHITLPDGELLAHGFQPALAFSRDGRMLAFPVMDTPTREEIIQRGFNQGRRGLVLRRLDQPGLIPIPGTNSESAQPVFSLDGAWIAYVSGSQNIYKTPVAGGQPIRLGAAPGSVLGLAWCDDDTILIGQHLRLGLHQVPAAGGPITPLTEPDDDRREIAHALPHALPGAGALYTAFGGELSSRSESIYALDRESGASVLLIENGAHPQYAHGHIVFVRDGELMAAPFDPVSLRVTGAARLLGESVMQHKHYGNISMLTHAGQFALSRSGSIAMGEGSIPPEPESYPILLDTDGVESPLDIERRSYLFARVTRDGAHTLLSTMYTPTRSLWLHDADRGVSRRIVRPSSIWAALGPGERDITYSREREDGAMQIGFLPLDAPPSGFTPIQAPAGEPIETPVGAEIVLAEWSRDGRRLVVLGADREMEPLSTAAMRIWIHERDSGWRMFTPGFEYMEAFPTFSPDGRRLAYVTDETGRREVYVRLIDEPGPTQQISVGGGQAPRWSDSGDAIYYRTTPTPERPVGAIYRVEVEDAGGRLRIGRPEHIVDTKNTYISVNPVRSWDMTPDGRFIFIRTGPDELQDELLLRFFPDRIRIVQNWTERLAR